MSKENVIQGIIALIVAGVSAYFQIIAIPLLVLMVVMVTDYITGMASAYIRKEFSSKVGIIGAVKKVSYIALVCVGICADYLIHTALTQLGVHLNIQLLFGLLVTIWLIINELISILENLSKIGVPMPSFLMKLVKRLKISVESRAEDTTE